MRFNIQIVKLNTVQIIDSTKNIFDYKKTIFIGDFNTYRMAETETPNEFLKYGFTSTFHAINNKILGDKKYNTFRKKYM